MRLADRRLITTEEGGRDMHYRLAKWVMAHTVVTSVAMVVLVMGSRVRAWAQAPSGCTAAKFAAAAGSPVGVGDLPGSVAVGDFNRDGNPDLATADVGSNSVTILL